MPPRRILVVDSKVDVADSLTMLIELSGHSVQVAYHADTALQAARAQIPDIVLLDIGLPGMDGYELAGRPRTSGRQADGCHRYNRIRTRLRSREAGGYKRSPPQASGL